MANSLYRTLSVTHCHLPLKQATQCALYTAMITFIVQFCDVFCLCHQCFFMSQNVSHKRDFKQPRHDLYTSSSRLSVEYLGLPSFANCTVPSLSVNLSLQIREGQRVGAFYVWLSRGAGVQGCGGPSHAITGCFRF